MWGWKRGYRRLTRKHVLQGRLRLLASMQLEKDWAGPHSSWELFLKKEQASATCLKTSPYIVSGHFPHGKRRPVPRVPVYAPGWHRFVSGKANSEGPRDVTVQMHKRVKFFVKGGSRLR